MDENNTTYTQIEIDNYTKNLINKLMLEEIVSLNGNIAVTNRNFPYYYDFIDTLKRVKYIKDNLTNNFSLDNHDLGIFLGVIEQLLITPYNELIKRIDMTDIKYYRQLFYRYINCYKSAKKH